MPTENLIQCVGHFFLSSESKAMRSTLGNASKPPFLSFIVSSSSYKTNRAIPFRCHQSRNQWSSTASIRHQCHEQSRAPQCSKKALLSVSGPRDSRSRPSKDIIFLGSRPCTLSRSNSSSSQAGNVPNAPRHDLPSQEEGRRSPISKRFSHVMDHLQSNIFIAGQRLNDLTGYSGIETLKRNIEAQGLLPPSLSPPLSPPPQIALSSKVSNPSFRNCPPNFSCHPSASPRNLLSSHFPTLKLTT